MIALERNVSIAYFIITTKLGEPSRNQRVLQNSQDGCFFEKKYNIASRE